MPAKSVSKTGSKGAKRERLTDTSATDLVAIRTFTDRVVKDSRAADVFSGRCIAASRLCEAVAMRRQETVVVDGKPLSKAECAKPWGKHQSIVPKLRTAMAYAERVTPGLEPTAFIKLDDARKVTDSWTALQRDEFIQLVNRGSLADERKGKAKGDGAGGDGADEADGARSPNRTPEKLTADYVKTMDRRGVAPEDIRTMVARETEAMSAKKLKAVARLTADTVPALIDSGNAKALLAALTSALKVA